ncbi:MAG: hypothetical protein R3271_14405, partial [Methylophaga sp.]|uniref:hypothetical protein n=1 Tax=Methylophaga sp. TaxID=2024840 RepID=UPI00299E3C57
VARSPTRSCGSLHEEKTDVLYVVLSSLPPSCSLSTIHARVQQTRLENAHNMSRLRQGLVDSAQVAVDIAHARFCSSLNTAD